MTTAEIIAYFDREDKAAGHQPGKILKRTQFGEFSSTPLGALESCIEELRRERAIPQEGILFDGGYGDGRVLSLTAEKGYDPYGLEGDYELAQRGRTNDGLLLRLGLRRNDRAVILGHGNFTNTKDYRDLGISVGDIDIFFNYQSNGDALAQLIAVESPVGTKFLYVSHNAGERTFITVPQLVHKQKKQLKLERNVPMYLHVYEKVSDLRTHSLHRHAHLPRASTH